MKTKLMLALLLSAATVPAFAQDTLTSTSGSDSSANSGSVSGAQSNGNQQGQSQTANNAGIGSSESNSASSSGAVSGSESVSGSVSDQTQGQSQGQSLSNGNTNQLGATNQQGVTVNQTWNSAQPLRRTYVGTNNAVPLAASSSFSSDYCGGTASGGVSAAPIGISIGGAAPTFDKSCQSLRRAEKFGMAAANWSNLGYPDRAVAMMRMMEWSICTSDSKGPKGDTSIAEACDLVLSNAGSPPSAPPPQATYAPEPAIQDQSGKVTPEATIKAGERGASYIPKEISRIEIAASQPPKP